MKNTFGHSYFRKTREVLMDWQEIIRTRNPKFMRHNRKLKRLMNEHVDNFYVLFCNIKN